MKWASHPVSSQTEGNKVATPERLYQRQAGPAWRSRLITTSSPHPEGHRITNNLSLPRSTRTPSPGVVSIPRTSPLLATTPRSLNGTVRIAISGPAHIKQPFCQQVSISPEKVFGRAAVRIDACRSKQMKGQYHRVLT